MLAPPDTKVSATPSSNRLAFTFDGICVASDWTGYAQRRIHNLGRPRSTTWCGGTRRWKGPG